MTPAEFLAEAAARKSDDPVAISVRELLALWGHVSRGPAAVAEITKALAGAGLATEPDFRFVRDMRDTVRVVGAEEDEPPVAGETGEDEVPADGEPEERFPPVSLCVGELPSARRGVLAVDINDPLRRAQTLMMRHGYSQLAVLDGADLRGAVTWESISDARISGLGGELRHHLMGVSPEVLHPEDKLLDRIPEISRHGFAFVAEAGKLSGIITTADLSERFAMLAGPFLLISEIERRIRRHIDKVCTLEDIRAAASQNKVESVHGLTFGGCRHVLMKADIWSRLGWDVDHGLFLEDLKEVNGIRNEVMHFRPEPLTPARMQTLENFAKWLRRLDPLP